MKYLYILLLSAACTTIFSSCESDKGGLDDMYDDSLNDKDDKDDKDDPDTNEPDIDFSKVEAVDGHPFLMFSVEDLPAIAARCKNPGWQTDLMTSLTTSARTFYTDSDMVPFKMERSGKYSFLTVGRATGAYIINLAFCGYVLGEERYIKRAKEILLSTVALTEPKIYQTSDSKTPAITQALADNKAGKVVGWTTHLQMADALHGLTLGYDLLYPYLSESEREAVRTELISYGKVMPTEAIAKGYVRYDQGSSATNHTTVHFGPVGILGLLIQNDYENAPDKGGISETIYSYAKEWQAIGERHITSFIRFAADNTGYILEGHGYQSYAMGGAFPLIHALKINDKGDISQHPSEFYTPGVKPGGLDKATAAIPLWPAASKLESEPWLVTEENYKNFIPYYGDQMLWKALPNGHILIMNDNRDSAGGDGAVLGSLMSSKPEQVWAWMEATKYNSSKKFSSVSLGSVFIRPYLLLFDADVKPHEPKEGVGNWSEIGLSKYFTGGRIFARSAWGNADAAHFGFTSGFDAHHGHNHVDENHVTFAALGEQFLYDAEYEAKFGEFHSLVAVGHDNDRNGFDAYTETYGGDSSDKYSMPNNRGRAEGTRGQLVSWQDRGGAVYVKGEAKNAYDKRANLTKSQRQALFVRTAPQPYLLFRDDLTITSSGQFFYPRYITHVDNSVSPYAKNDNYAVITGCYKSRKAIIMAFEGVDPIKLSKDDVSGESYVKGNNSKKYYYDKLIVRISGKTATKATSTAITTIVLPYTAESDIPEVKATKGASSGEYIYTLTYSNGTVHTITTTDSSISKS